MAKTWRKGIGMFLVMAVLVAAVIGCGGGGTSNPPPADTQTPTAPTGLTAAAANDTKINLNWTASTDNVGVTGYLVFRGTAQVGTTATTSYSDTGLTASTQYTYTVKARDAAGNSSLPSSAASATTLAAGTSDTQAPTAPSGLSATASGSTSIALTWTASTDNSGVSGYNIYRATSASGTATKVGSSSVTSYSDTGLAAGTAYYYTIKAYDGANNESLASNQATATTSAAGTTPPPGTAILTVKVRDYSSAPLAGVTVVLGDSTGAMVSASSYQVTGVSGDVTFVNPPANATVTFARSRVAPWNSSQTIFELHSLYDVNVSSIAMDFENSASTIGTANVTVNNGLGTAVNGWSILPGWTWGAPTYNNPAAVTVRQGDVQSDNKVSFIVLGQNASQDVMGFGTAFDQTFVTGMSFTINLNQTAFATVNHTISNVPGTAVEVSCGGRAIRKGAGDTWIDSYAATIAATTTCTGRTIPSYGDKFEYELGISLDRNSNGNPDAYQGVWKGGAATFTAQTVDISTLPAIPAGATMTGTGTARPTVSWTGNDTSADEIWGSIFYSTATAQYDYIFETAPSRTSAQFPELPGTLSTFVPTSWITANGVEFSLENDALVGVSGYNALLTTIESWILGNASGTMEGQWSGIRIVNGQTPKPELSKASASMNSGTRRAKAFQR